MKKTCVTCGKQEPEVTFSKNGKHYYYKCNKCRRIRNNAQPASKIDERHRKIIEKQNPVKVFTPEQIAEYERGNR